MTRVLLDTSAYSAFLRGHQRIKVALQEADQIWLCSIVLGELKAGFRRGKHRRQNETLLETFLCSSRVDVLSIDPETAERYAEIIAFLRNAGTPIPTNDIWIAACAMQHGLVVLTTDTHYQKVPQALVVLFEAE